jgi:hypothetical protein
MKIANLDLDLDVRTSMLALPALVVGPDRVGPESESPDGLGEDMGASIGPVGKRAPSHG